MRVKKTCMVDCLIAKKTLKPHKTCVCNFVQITLGGEVMQSTIHLMKNTQVTQQQSFPLDSNPIFQRTAKINFPGRKVK